MEIQQFIDFMFSYLVGWIFALGGIGTFLLCAIWFVAGMVLVFVAENTNETIVIIVIAFIVPLVLVTISYITIINQKLTKWSERRLPYNNSKPHVNIVSHTVVFYLKAM
jgi:hypothetical protein